MSNVNVRYRGQPRKHMLALSSSQFDPKRAWTAKEVDQFDAQHLTLDSLLPLALIAIPDNL
jgi:hypothetical protein